MATGLRWNKRRTWGSACLGAALLMLVLGETLLNHRLSNAAFLLYWCVCFLLTCMAIFIALVDVKITQRVIRNEQRNLLDATIKEIEVEARAKKRVRRNQR